MASPPDQHERSRAVRSRDRNLLVDAGAGTGKTTLIVERLLEMVAPIDDGRSYPLERIAAITFTRRAAGELRFRVRQQLLRRLAEPTASEVRRNRLREALGALDTAFIGTIHSFADRLLRLYPVEAKISPAYAMDDDPTETMFEAFRLLLESAQSGTLEQQLAGTPVEAMADEATRTVLDALAAGLRPDTEWFDTFMKPGLDLLVQRMLEQRDVLARNLGTARFDRSAFDGAARELEARVGALHGDGKGERWCRRLVRKVVELEAKDEPVVLCELLGALYEAVESDRKLRQKDFADKDGRTFWKDFSTEEPALADRLVAPLRRWLAVRLARLAPVAQALYERIKSRRGVVDSIDLLLKLRDLLQNDLDARAALQRRFDHVFVDEFQDTDPLQAEIVLYLCESEPRAQRWQDVSISEGRLTIVGDPKQSIYRFRRADVALYDAVREHIARGPHESVRLSTNFRSQPALIAWQNRCFEALLGKSPNETPFDAATGVVFHQPLIGGREEAPEATVHLVPYLLASDDGVAKTAPPAREVEADAIAHYIQWLSGERSGVTVTDPLTNERRRVRASDIAILALATTNVPILLRALDRVSVPYAAFGGKLFLSDPLHQQFLLGLRALADRADGVAEAALLRPPFFAIDLADLVGARAERDPDRPPTEETKRVRAAMDWVREARRCRFERSIANTARALLEETAFGRTIALGPNGAQRLAMLHELCLSLEHLAAQEGLDFDAVTARAREWVLHPIALDPPRLVASDAVQVMTAHQAKGLEFPVVVLWDGMGPLKPPHRSAIWTIDRLGDAWTIQVAGLKWEEPANSGLTERELSFIDAERRRLIYVAATRARDLFVVPRPKLRKPEGYVCETLIRAGGEDDPTVRVLDPWKDGEGASWATLAAASNGLPLGESDAEAGLAARWRSSEMPARIARFRPVGIAAWAHDQGRAATRDVVEVSTDESMARPVPVKRREGRFGPVFGETVHRAIGWALAKGIAPDRAVRRAARATELEEPRWHDAAKDVERALATLTREGLVSADHSIRLEYPIAARATREGAGDAVLLSGYIDLVAASSDGGEIIVIDFKTDPSPNSDVHLVYPGYVEQVLAYARLVGGGANTRAGLLFTSTGEVYWC